MATTDYRAEQLQTKQIIASGSLANGLGAKLVIYPIDANGAPPNKGWIDQNVFNTGSLAGQDIFLFVSGGIGHKDTNNRSISVFGGDVHVSGTLYGGNIASNQWIEGTPSPRLRTSASVAIGSGTSFAQNIGSNIFFYVSGNIGTNTDISVFGGDTYISGNLIQGLQDNSISSSHNSLIIGSFGNNVTASNNSAIIGAESGSIVYSSGSVILGGINTYSTISESISSAIIAGDSNFIYAGSWNSAMIAASNSAISASFEAFVAGTNSGFINDSYYSAIIGSFSSEISGSSTSIIGGGAGNVIIAYDPYAGTDGGHSILGSRNSIISASIIIPGTETANSIINSNVATISGSRKSYIYGSDNSTVINNASGSGIIGSRTSNIIGSVNSTILGSDISNITLGTTNTILGSYNTTVSTSAGYSVNFVLGGYNSTISGATGQVGIIGGYSNNIAGDSGASYIFGGNLNDIGSVSTFSSIINADSSRLTNTYYGSIINSTNSSITTNQSSFAYGVNTILGSYNSNMVGDVNASLAFSAIIAGNSHTLNGSSNAVIVGGNVNTITQSATYSSIIAGDSNVLQRSVSSVILGGTLNRLSNSYTAGYSAIVAGSTNKLIAADYSIILGGQNNTISGVIGFTNQNLSILGGNRNLIGNGATFNQNIFMLGTGLSSSGETNKIYLGGNNYSTIISGGLTGSLQRTITGNSYIIGGPNITVTTNSLGQIEISGSAASSGSTSYQWIESSTVPRIRTSASVAIGSGTSFAQDFGSDIYFYVSGAVGATSGKSVFGGDVVVSGAVNLRAGMTLSGALRYNIPTSITGTYTVSTNDYIIPVSTTGSAMTIVLDSAAATQGRAFVIKDIAGSASINNITLSASFGKIDGTSTYVIAVNRQAATVVCFTSSNSDTTWGMI